MCRSETMKKLIALILCVAMALALCACNNNNSEEETTTVNYDTVSTDSVVIGPAEDAKIFEGDDGSSSAYYYDENGQLVLVCSYAAGDVLKEAREYS